MADKRSRKETFENFLDHTKNGGMGAAREHGYGPRDPMCFDQHIQHRLLHPEVKSKNPATLVFGKKDRELADLEVTGDDLIVLRARHNAEMRYRKSLGETDSKGGAKFKDLPEFLERIISGEPITVNGYTIDVNADYATLVEKELKEAAARDAERGRVLHDAYQRREVVERQRLMNQQTLRELVQVHQDFASGDVIWSQNGEEVHRLSQEQLRDGSAHRQVRVPVPNNDTFVSYANASCGVAPTTQYQTLTTTLGTW